MTLAAPIRSNASRCCLMCDGTGFFRSGDFAHRSFPRCNACGGCGRVYVDPTPAPVASKAATQVWPSFR